MNCVWGCCKNKDCGSSTGSCGCSGHGLHGKSCIGWGVGVIGNLLCKCKSGCNSCKSDIVVHAISGETRIVPYLIKNETSCPIQVTPQVSPWSACGCGANDSAGGPVLQPAGPFTIEPCGSASFDIVLSTKGLNACTCYCSTITLAGTSCEKIDVMLCLGGKVPAICHHTPTKLLTWIRQSCFGMGKYVAPAPYRGCGCGSCCK